MEQLVSSSVAALIALLATVLGFRLQERSAARRERHAQQAQQRMELRQVFVRFLTRLAAMRRLQNMRSVLREKDASEAEQTAAKQAALEARTAAGEALTELQLLTDDPQILQLADRLVDVTFTLHQAPDQADRDRRGDLARAAHKTFTAAAGPLVRA
ncbi:hypothetical protein [Streptomyces malaysiensis]|uniref:Uncharacterized protein n=1 Tax=Streptomyces malaysiensis subsp. samsunensis TaxID=459658 RepID=A0A9X2M514_STRMQ|nr:hypothetical protein [Streptomyces samsunensis]MCQ8835831.1 hypothetical protein [Streptomyces samsunensis]